MVQLKTNSRNAILSANQTRPGTQVKGAYGTGDIQPPRNSTAPIADSRIMLAYSPRKNRPKVIDEYSVWKPWTSSASDIGRSNGVRLVSASAETKKITNIGSSGSQNQLKNQPDWAITTWVRLSEPTQSRTVISTKPIETS